MYWNRISTTALRAGLFGRAGIWLGLECYILMGGWQVLAMRYAVSSSGVLGVACKA